MLPTSVVCEWRQRARIFRDHEQPSVAIAYEQCADELEQALNGADETPLTLAEAAAFGGYSSDHLGRLVREKRIPNAGRSGAPRIARRDVPIKTGHVARGEHTRDIDRRQIVRLAIDEGAA